MRGADEHGHRWRDPGEGIQKGTSMEQEHGLHSDLRTWHGFRHDFAG